MMREPINLTPPPPMPDRPLLLSVMLEDYFHVGNFSHTIRRDQWYRFQTRFEENTLKTLDLLDHHGVRATFFVLAWVAERRPELVREVASRGHEIASRGLYRRRRDRPTTAAEFRDDLRRGRAALGEACGVAPAGFRAPHAWTSLSDLWALDVLAEEGYEYDTSFLPTVGVVRREPWRRFAHRHQASARAVWEIPVPTINVFGRLVPVGGGNYFRQIPHTVIRHAVERWHSSYDAPFSMYFHVWELDPEQPRISAASIISRARQYRKLDKLSWVLEDYFARYRFMPVGEHLGLTANSNSAPSVERPYEIVGALPPASPAWSSAGTVSVKASSEGARKREHVTVVVPCFNEELALLYLANTLRSVESALASDYRVYFVFVDDCSTDATWEGLGETFGGWPDCLFVRHDRNLGVATAIRTGVSHASSEIVCSIDCDCTYDPHELLHMIPLLTKDVAIVTASPYHPRGKVRNVPGWRLSLSRGASFLYRRVLRQEIHTFTSCFRVYRRSAVIDIDCSEGGFLGVAEMLGRLVLGGGTVVEHPATLEVRLFGQSKMKVLRTIAGHLRLLSKLLATRLRQGGSVEPPARDLMPIEFSSPAVGPSACAADGGDLFHTAATPAGVGVGGPLHPAVTQVTLQNERTTLAT